MSKKDESFNSSRRRLLRLLGFGAAGTVLGAVVVSDKVFAKQFVADGTRMTVPNMIYEPRSQMMVDPLTHQPIYQDPRKIYLATPVVTAGCGDCPKRDDCKDDMCR